MGRLNSKTVKSSGGSSSSNQPVLEVGSYEARIVRIIDLGVQKRPDFEGKAKEPWAHVQIVYELCDEFMLDEDGNEDETKPLWLFETLPFFSLDVSNAKSTQRQKALDPTGEHDGELQPLLSAPCNVGVVHGKKLRDDGTPWVNVGSVTAMTTKKAAKAPELVNEPLYFEMTEEYIEEFMALHEKTQEKIKSALDYEGSCLEAAVDDYVAPDEDEKPKKKKAKPKKDEEPPFEADEDKPKPKAKKAKAKKKPEPEPEEEDDEDDEEWED